MKIGMLTGSYFGIRDMMEAFSVLGHQVCECPFSKEIDVAEIESAQLIESQLREMAVDSMFTFNYYPSVSIACKNLGIPYMAWVYDSPYVLMYHYTIANPTNYVFVFDKSVYLEFHKGGINTVYYLPMAANVERLSKLTEEGSSKLEHEIAFVGSLYTEEHQFFQRLKNISGYTRGYLEGLMKAQKQVYGCNFVQGLLPKEIIEDMSKDLPLHVNPEGIESIEYLFAQYVINRQITAQERQELLGAIAAKYGLDLFTPDRTFRIPGCTNHGTVEVYEQAPHVYKNTAININITLRSIITGIPLRAFEIMGAGGFLLTNYQDDFLDFFVPDEDFVYFESKQDMLNKIDYYLKHPSERRAIAENGCRRVAQGHTFVHRAEEMLSCLKGI